MMNNDNNQRPAPGARRQYFDIARPGRTPASPTSRPVLASNQPPVKDTSMKPSGAPAVPPGFLSDQQKTAAPASPAPAGPPKPPAAPVQMIGGTKPRPATMQPQHGPALPRQQPQQDVGKAAVDYQVAPEEPANQEQQLADAHPQQPHHEGRHLLSEIIAIVAIVLLIAIIINILADADILNLPIPHTNFFDY